MIEEYFIFNIRLCGRSCGRHTVGTNTLDTEVNPMYKRYCRTSLRCSSNVNKTLPNGMQNIANKMLISAADRAILCHLLGIHILDFILHQDNVDFFVSNQKLYIYE